MDMTMTRVTIQLSYRTPEGADRVVNVPAEATDYAEGDLGAALAAVIIALHDRVTTLERIIAQAQHADGTGEEWGEDIDPALGEGLFSEAEAQAAAEAQTDPAEWDDNPGVEGPRDV